MYTFMKFRLNKSYYMDLVNQEGEQHYMFVIKENPCVNSITVLATETSFRKQYKGTALFKTLMAQSHY